MAKIIIAPGKYIQGRGEINNIGKYSNILGNKFFVIASNTGFKTLKESIAQSFKEINKSVEYELFQGECSENEVNRLKKICEEKNIDVILGIGGGKALDTAKAVAFYMNIPVVVVPTIASTDAPCSALSVLYTDDGVFDKYLFLPKNPDIVLVDTDIISKAPARFLVSGMGDALATYFEAKATLDSGKNAICGGTPTKAAMALAELCYNTLIEEGLKAKLAVEKGVCTPAVEAVIEANTYLSGLGFESGGLAACHAVHNGFTAIKECHSMYHGEKVAFGVITQLVLENASLDQIDEVMDFCYSVGLPITLKQLGIDEIKYEEIMKVAELAAVDGETIHNMPFPVTPESVYAAIIAADALGNDFLE